MKNRDESSTKKYRIQLSPAVALAVAGLGALSLVISFTLGVMTGKTLRQPQMQVRQAPATPQAATTENSAMQEEMEFFELSEEASVQQEPTLDIDRLEALLNKTEALKNEQDSGDSAASSGEQAQKSQTVRFVSTQTQTTTAPPSTSPTPPPTVQASRGETYTLQVATLSYRDSAESFIEYLKENGITDGYINQYVTDGDKTLYRVRVGRLPRDQAVNMAERLELLDLVQSVQMTRLD